ncbi:RelA/SpoT domain-containing protein [Acinetobacter baumannii]|nr:RelA/SpoT domain-containing protein [Acinetobacter baumannii]MDV7656301.1 RelA/SpoT domain-containing protein [Acinetobacter baumannii]
MKLSNYSGVLNEILSNISSKLDDIGLMYRIFGRVKDKQSLEKKLENDPEYGKSKKLQDLIGVRVVLYFTDDIPVTHLITSSIFKEISNSNSIDNHSEDKFKASRYNVVYTLENDLITLLKSDGLEDKVDNTFELQIRTIFSEGWHEIDHDFRYKCKDDWVDSNSHSRLLNGLFASLESSEWAMLQIFDDLSHKHYKSNKISEMLRHKLRLRFASTCLNQDLIEILKDENLAKKFFRIDRTELLIEMCNKDFYYPLTLDNILFFSNLLVVKNENILNITPSIMIEDFSLSEKS